MKQTTVRTELLALQCGQDLPSLRICLVFGQFSLKSVSFLKLINTGLFSTERVTIYDPPCISLACEERNLEEFTLRMVQHLNQNQVQTKILICDKVEILELRVSVNNSKIVSESGKTQKAHWEKQREFKNVKLELLKRR